MDSSVAASTLTRPRILVAAASLAATVTLGYYCYRAYNDSPEDPSFALPAEPARRLHRSNAIRHRRHSLPEVVQNNGDRGHSREPSEASYTSVESHDENLHLHDDNPDDHHDHHHHDPHDAESASGDAVAERHVRDDNWYDHEDHDDHHFGSGPAQRAGQNIVSLLFRVSEDNARRNAFVHRGCLCNGCGVTPIRGIRYRCANCTDFDLCETCEAQGMHTKTHIFYKIRVPIPRLGSRPLQPVWYPGDPENCLRLLPKHLMPKLTRETGFERPELEALWEQWTFMACTEWREDPDELGIAMDRKTFERYLVPSGGYHHMAPNLLHDRMFAFYDDNRDGLIGFAEFLRGTAYRKRKDRLRKIFRGYDIDDDGFISRRDCLRLFRAYYAVFKHMHRGILEGLEEQAMNAVEVDQVITGRQPLSSLFGREGGFSEADTDRLPQGKAVLSSGDARIIDGRNRAVNENSPDTADRQAILMGLFNRQSRAAESRFVPISRQQQNEDGERSGIEYLNSLLNPPNSIRELPTLLLGETRDGNDFLLVFNNRDSTVQDMQELDGDPADDALRSAENPQANGEGPSSGAAGGSVVHGARDENPSLESEGLRPSDRSPRRSPSYVVSSGRRARVNARRKLFDRWQRRQFYLDEEEGMLPPEDWSDDDDVLTRLEDAESKEEQPPPSARSRSSSKVRFAQDTDDYDIRSNPSTSSRSVPERWGGMEIRDAERDAGKEIFYQVAQQAFNEILDTLFKEKEDLAIRAAQTKELRDKYRHLFQSIDPNEQEPPAKARATPTDGTSAQDKTLEELLTETGYSIDPEAEKGTGAGETNEASAESEDALPAPIPDEPAAPQSAEPDVYRDPTMPQFRPNSDQDMSASNGQQRAPSDTSSAETQQSESAASPSSGLSSRSSNDNAPSTEGPDANDDKTNASSLDVKLNKKKKRRPGKHQYSATNPIPHSTLVTWKRLDLAEQEARARGGWGRLDYAEFERIYKAAEARGNRLDYLGTWIDFCIPST
ncbi:hypothetical protein VTJ83DRAFT_384 [Remersonia thermophila]|uniref:Uncharacterized protein n=1 Tax=Remersonia thermophila TaxID=72144 RepID=A0ABR4DKX2_9PEZI